MGLHISEIEPLGTLDAVQTQKLAEKLWGKSAAHTGLTPAMIGDALSHFSGSDGQSPQPAALAAAGWLQPEEVTQKRGFPPGRASLSDKVAEIVHAQHEPRMSFTEACAKIAELRDRLDSAPQQIEGIGIRGLYLFGSSLRDQNPRETIGDLDIVADFSFDKRYDGLDAAEKNTLARSLWKDTVGQGDSRLDLGSAEGLHRTPDTPERPFTVMRIWHSATGGADDSHTLDDAARIQLEAQARKTIDTQNRAQTVGAIVAGQSAAQDTPKAAPPKGPSAG
ncbi:MAG: hypothetical protein Q8K65_00675 [Alphaproteobacteria bacterium]|nr:hypothetical protein [Alphaproteobacteria bacterium]